MNPGSFKDDTASKSHHVHPQPARLESSDSRSPRPSPVGLESSDLNAVPSVLLHSQVFVTPFIQKMRSPPGLSLCSARPFLKVPQVGRTEHYCSLKRQEDIKEGPSGRNTWRRCSREPLRPTWCFSEMRLAQEMLKGEFGSDSSLLQLQCPGLWTKFPFLLSGAELLLCSSKQNK